MDVEKKTPCVRARPKRDWWAPCFHQSTKPYTIDSPGYRDQTGRLQSLDHLHKIRSIVIHLSQVSLTNGSSINVRKYWRPSLSVFIITSFLRHRAEYRVRVYQRLFHISMHSRPLTPHQTSIDHNIEKIWQHARKRLMELGRHSNVLHAFWITSWLVTCEDRRSVHSQFQGT